MSRPEEPETYVVRPGDTLSGIAERELGRTSGWKMLARLNSLDDPDLIYPGQRLKLLVRRTVT